jgi:predicted dehydrogenase
VQLRGNEMINVGIVGCGRISDLHAKAYLTHPNAHINAICDPSLEALEMRGDLWGVPVNRRFQHIEELLLHDDIDMVDVLVPHNLHSDMANKVIASGKALSLQKPMTVNLEEANQLIKAAELAGTKFKVFENFIFFPPIAFAKELVDQGEIGDLLGIRMKSNSGISDTAWKIPEATAAWRLDPEKCGGGPLVFDDGHHKFAVAWHFFGKVKSVYADIGSWENTGIDSPSIVSWRHQNGGIGSLEVIFSPELQVNTKYYAQDDQIELTGTKGVIWITKGHGQLLESPPVTLYKDGVVRHFLDIDYDWGSSFVKSGQHFIDALINGTDPLLTGKQGREVLAFTLAAQEASRLSIPVEPKY